MFAFIKHAFFLSATATHRAGRGGITCSAAQTPCGAPSRTRVFLRNATCYYSIAAAWRRRITRRGMPLAMRHSPPLHDCIPVLLLYLAISAVTLLSPYALSAAQHMQTLVGDAGRTDGVALLRAVLYRCWRMPSTIYHAHGRRGL
jgi:hypothetical protein